MKKSNKLACPAGLSANARSWWHRLNAQYDLRDDGGQFLLLQALISLDRATEAAKLIEKHGICFVDKFGQLKSNPACSTERDARRSAVQAFTKLGLEIEPLRPQPGRPPGTWSITRAD